MKRLVFLTTLLFAAGHHGYGLTTYTSTGSGDWSTGSTWSVSGSGSPNRYIIQAGHTVTVSSTPLFIDSIKVYGTLTFNSNVDLLMNNGGMIEVYSGGVIDGGNSSSDISFFLGSLSSNIGGPWTGSNTVNGPVYATKNTNGFVSMAALPVEILSFTAEKHSASVILKWITVTETNNDHFNIQRSKDGVNWVSIGSVKGNGSSSHIINYSFTDLQPANGSNFYRFVEVDYNNNSQFSSVLWINIETACHVSVSAYPNPADNVIQVSYNYDSDVNADDLIVTDQTGRIVNIPIQSDNKKLLINTEQLIEGVYYLNLPLFNYKALVVIRHDVQSNQ